MEKKITCCIHNTAEISVQDAFLVFHHFIRAKMSKLPFVIQVIREEKAHGIHYWEDEVLIPLKRVGISWDQCLLTIVRENSEIFNKKAAVSLNFLLDSGYPPIGVMNYFLSVFNGGLKTIFLSAQEIADAAELSHNSSDHLIFDKHEIERISSLYLLQEDEEFLAEELYHFMGNHSNTGFSKEEIVTAILQCKEERGSNYKELAERISKILKKI